MPSYYTSYNDNVLTGTRKEIEYSTCWATILYSEEVLNKCIEICKTRYYSCVISPIHNKDKFDNGEPKKDHYHALFVFKSKKSRNQMFILFNEIGGVGAEHINNKEAYYRYLWHDQETDKPIYDFNDLKFINCNENDFINNIAILNNLIDIIVTENVYNFSQLREKIIDYYGEINSPILYTFSTKANLLDKFIKDNQFKKVNEMQKELNIKEGQIQKLKDDNKKLKGI